MFAEELRSLVFLGAGAMTVASAVLIIFFDNLLHGAISLFFTLMGVAVLYILMGADFLGISQILVYAGGVLVLIIFGIFLTTPHVDELKNSRKNIATWLTIGFGLLLFRLLYKLIVQMPWVTFKPSTVPTIDQIGHLFLSKYLLPFELISVVLLFVLIGSILIVRKDLRQ